TTSTKHSLRSAAASSASGDSKPHFETSSKRDLRKSLREERAEPREQRLRARAPRVELGQQVQPEVVGDYRVCQLVDRRVLERRLCKRLPQRVFGELDPRLHPLED